MAKKRKPKHVHGPGCGHDHHDQGPKGPELTAVMEDLGPCRKLLKVEVPSGEIRKEIDQRLKKLSKTVHLKGFRPGKAPRSRIEKIYGEMVRGEARDHLLRQGYMKALEDNLGETKVLGEGTIENVDFDAEEGLKFEVTLHTRPEFDLGDYKGVEVSATKLVVEDSHIEDAIDQFRRTRGELKPVEGEDAVVEGEDLLEVDVQVWMADEYETFAQGEEQDPDEAALKPLKEEQGLKVQLPLDVLGQYQVEDLADSLQGLKIGEWGEAETGLSPDYEVVEGRNEPAVVRVCIKSIQRVFLPELTEEWVKEAGHDSIADLKREMREQLQQRMEMARSREIEEKVLAALLEQVGEFDLPADIVDKEIENAERRRIFELRIQEGQTQDQAEGKVAEERDEIAVGVERMLRHFFLLDEIAQAEEIKVSDSDVNARIARLAASRGESPSKIKAELEEQNVLPQIRHELMDEKTRAFLREHASVTEEED